jgi:2-polyprenyl-6-methoxyphenol hydroxylase-like FAD-dependent oxidoreductase
MEHAVVVGGSMAGLLCTRALADHCDCVTIVERDTFPTSVENRRGVPQGCHTHGLLASGRDVLERFFPGISEELIRAGAVPGDLARDCRWFIGGARLASFTSGLQGLLMSRPFLETAVRQGHLDAFLGRLRVTHALQPMRAVGTAAGRIHHQIGR